MHEFAQIADDLRKHLNGHTVDLAIDVGANRGQTVEAMLRQYPDVTIHAFEPIAATFAVLSRKYGQRDNVHLENCALGAKKGTATMIAKATSTANRIVTTPVHVPTQEVDVITGDAYCGENDIGRIGFLKIDTEGFDLDVLKGFGNMLASQSVAVIQVEAAMNPTNTKHVPFDTLASYLAGNKYYLFHIYEQVHEMDGRPMLRRANLVFLSEPLIISNKKPRHG